MPGPGVMRALPSPRGLAAAAAALVLLLVSQTPPVPAQAQTAAAGTLDASFGRDGIVTTSVLTAESKAHAMAVQSDGKLLVAGESRVGSNLNFALARYTADGTLDTAFGDGDGVVTTDFHNQDDLAYAVTVLDDGTILVAGHAFNGGISDFALARYTAEGALDATFGTGGKVTTRISARHDVIRAMAVQSDGKIVVAGGSNNDFAVARYTADGVLDTTFSSDGKVTVDFSTLGDFATAVAVQADGKVLVTGYSHNQGNYDLALARYTDTGELDTTFSTDGKVTTDFGDLDYGYAMALQSDGKIVVAGLSWTGSSEDFALARYTDTGVLDTTFSGDGKVTTGLSSGYDSINALLVLSDGKLLVAGRSGNSFALARYTSTGVLDTTFGSDADNDNTPDGYVITAIGAGADQANAMALQPGGKIVVAGQSHNGTHEDFALARYSAAGSLDTAFGTGGKVTTAVGAAEASARGVAVQSDGKIVAAGYAKNGSNYDFALVRYNPDGSLDTAFGTGGKVTTDFNSPNDNGITVAVQSDGKIVAAGHTKSGNARDFALARYTDLGDLDTSFGTGGKVTTDFSSYNDRLYAMAVQPDGRIVLAGYAHNGSNQDFALVRYTDTGALDTGFGTGGKVTTAIGGGHDLIRAIALLAGGKVLAAGQSHNGSNYDFALARYNADGSLDTTFGGDG